MSMMGESLVIANDFAMLLLAAAVLSYIARLLRQPTIVAYILTGVLVGPVVFGLVTEDTLIEILAELGLGFLLFLLGVEMRFDRIRGILKQVGTIAVGQAILQGVASTLVALLLGFTLFQSLMIALATTFGATPIIIKVLDDMDELKELYGRVNVGILIFQDFYLILALAILSVDAAGDPVVVGMNMLRVSFVLLVVIAFTLFANRYLVPTLIRASSRRDEILFTVVTAWALAFILLAELTGLTVELGGFFAGLALAQLPYSVEIKERMRPVTNFFIVIFFASIGLQMETAELLAYWQEAIIACVLLLGMNFCIVFGLYISQGFNTETSFLGTVSMLQVSEFSLVLGALAVAQGYLDTEVLGFFSLMALITMPLSTYLIIYNRQLYERVEPYLSWLERDEPIEADLGGHQDHAVVVGVNEYTKALLPELKKTCGEVVVIDRSITNVEKVEQEIAQEVSEVVFGDTRHAEIRKEADIERAAVIVSFADRGAVNHRLAVEADDDALVIVRAGDIAQARALSDAGATSVFTMGSITTTAIADLIEQYFSDQEAFEERSQTRRALVEGEEQ